MERVPDDTPLWAPDCDRCVFSIFGMGTASVQMERNDHLRHKNIIQHPSFEPEYSLDLPNLTSWIAHDHGTSWFPTQRTAVSNASRGLRRLSTQEADGSGVGMGMVFWVTNWFGNGLEIGL